MHTSIGVGRGSEACGVLIIADEGDTGQMSFHNARFEQIGKELEEHGYKKKILVVGNNANTNALIISKNAPSIPKKNIVAMSRLD